MTSGRRSKAERKARITATWSQAASWPQIEEVGQPRDVPGCTAFVVGGKGGALVLLPSLLPGAPEDIQLAYYGRVLANATGRCPRCDAAASVEASSMMHADACEVGAFADIADRWCDPLGVATLNPG